MELVTRQFVIETYIRYDSRKKDKPFPDNFANWDWSSADALDAELARYQFKSGIIAGYLYWAPVEFGRPELSRCAIVNHIFSSASPRVLGNLAGNPVFEEWKPDKAVEWYSRLDSGEPYPPDWPMIFRPAIESEAPAKWYIEDGSGRGICFYRNLVHTDDYLRKAFGYLGVNPDPNSSFMGLRFPQLLR